MMGSGGKVSILRNLDRSTLRDGLDGPLYYYNLFPLGDSSSGTIINSGCDYNSIPNLNSTPGTVYQAHLAEGVGSGARSEWFCSSTALQGTDPTLPGPSIVHAIAMTAEDIPSLATARATVVWSQRSDIMLYGMTTPASAMSAMTSLQCKSEPVGQVQHLALAVTKAEVVFTH